MSQYRKLNNYWGMNIERFNEANRFYKKESKKESKKDPIKAVILIISSDTLSRHITAKNIWKKYMNKHPNIDCFFLEFKEGLTKDIIRAKNHIYVKGKDSFKPGIFNKTMKSMNLLQNEYDYFIRTNISTFWDLNKLYTFLMNLPINKVHYSNSIVKVGETSMSDYAYGTNIILSKDITQEIVKMYNKYKNLSYTSWPKYKELCNNPADDTLIGYMVKYATNTEIYGYKSTEMCKYFVQGFNRPNDENWKKIINDHKDAIGFRVKTSNYNEIYNFLLDKIYDE